jgi:hypothetical protein
VEREVVAIVTVGIDLAKTVFAVHGVDETGKAVLVCPEVSFASPISRESAHYVPRQDAFWL